MKKLPWILAVTIGVTLLTGTIISAFGDTANRIIYLWNTTGGGGAGGGGGLSAGTNANATMVISTADGVTIPTTTGTYTNIFPYSASSGTGIDIGLTTGYFTNTTEGYYYIGYGLSGDGTGANTYEFDAFTNGVSAGIQSTIELDASADIVSDARFSTMWIPANTYINLQAKNLTGGNNFNITNLDFVVFNLMSGTNSSGGAGTPSGGDTMVQLNDGGSFGGLSNLVYFSSTGEIVSTNVIGSGSLRVRGGFTVHGNQTNIGSINLFNNLRIDTGDVLGATDVQALDNIFSGGEAGLDSLTVTNTSTFDASAYFNASIVYDPVVAHSYISGNTWILEEPTASPFFIWDRSTQLVSIGDDATAVKLQLENGIIGTNTSYTFLVSTANVANAIVSREHATNIVNAIAGGASQTPWTSDIDAAGFDLNDASRIGIGTNAPGSDLHIRSTSPFIVMELDNQNAHLRIGTGYIQLDEDNSWYFGNNSGSGRWIMQPSANNYALIPNGNGTQPLGLAGSRTSTNYSQTVDTGTIIATGQSTLDDTTFSSGARLVSYPANVNGSVIRTNEGSRQYAKLGVLTNFTASTGFTNDIISVDMESAGFPVGFMGTAYYGSPGGVDIFDINYAGGTTNVATSMNGIVEKAYATPLFVDAALGTRYVVTNRISGVLNLVFTNGYPGIEYSVTVLGEASGGTSRVITMTPELGHLVADMDTFGTALATTSTQTLTNGNKLEINWLIQKENGTNVASKVSRQATF